MSKHRAPDRSDMLTDFVVGMSDGLSVPFAVTAGLAGAVVTNTTVIMGGVAGMLIGAIAMGVGGYFAGRGEIDQAPEDVARMEFGRDTQHAITREILKDNEVWSDIVADHNLYTADAGTARRSALNIALFYLLGGLIPVLPYFFLEDIKQGLLASSVLTLISLAGFGFFKAVVTGQNRWSTSFRSVFFGGAVATAAYFIGTLFQ